MSKKYLPTGNQYISLPTICQDDASIESFTLLHMGYKGMLVFHGTESEPLLMPTISIDNEVKILPELVWERIGDWILMFNTNIDGIKISGIIFCPLGHRGFVYQLKIDNQKETTATVNIGFKGTWAGVTHSVNEDKEIDGRLNIFHSNWTDAPVFELMVGTPVMAFSPMSCQPLIWKTENINNNIRYHGSHTETLAPNGTYILDLFFGVGFEEVAAATSAKEQLRHGFEALYQETADWLFARRQSISDRRLNKMLNLNMFFNYFYATGYTIDTEEAVMVTSRSPRYYVSAAYWDRDALLWSFPAIMRIDKDYARELLDYVFTRQIRNVGIHSRYIDGTVLEPGFELDELCAPALALYRYIDVTGDVDFLKEPHIEKGIKRILKLLMTKKSPINGLYETFLQPTDDMRTYPYLTYNNILTWRMLSDTCEKYDFLWSTETIQLLKDEAANLHNAIEKYCIHEYQGKLIYVWSVNEKGDWDVYDEPPGSLQLLPAFGFCDFTDPVWQNTVAAIRHPDYRYSFAGKAFADIGCAHAPHPWILSVCNSLLCQRTEEAVDFLLRADMDNGIACESVDENTGVCATGAAFATCAGFLVDSLLKALG